MRLTQVDDVGGASQSVAMLLDRVAVSGFAAAGGTDDKLCELHFGVVCERGTSAAIKLAAIKCEQKPVKSRSKADRRSFLNGECLPYLFEKVYIQPYTGFV